ncbi:MAG: EamA family transporter RarD [Neisseriaceae bacterium]|nr:EamA family transporter RarD [Neisseriaceae bacterium]
MKSTLSQQKQGIILALATFIMWGVFPIYFKLLSNVNPVTILANRIIWSFVLLFILLIGLRRLHNIRRLLHLKKVTAWLLLSGSLISCNWGIFIYAVEQGQILETSLGYFINPFFSILLGALVLGEKLSTIAKIATFIVLIAIGIQIYAMRGLPFIAIILPLTFALYGLIRKKITIPPLEGLFIETALITPLAIAFLIYTNISITAINIEQNTLLLLILSGAVTVFPLLTFIAATHRLPLSTIGFMQYISPSISLLVAVFLYHEHLDTYKLISFILIWLSLLMTTITSLRNKNHKTP